MHFCPQCGNLLIIEVHDCQHAFSCRTCPYVYKLDTSLRKRTEFATKKEDHILNNEDEMKFANICEKRCKCGCMQAAYYQMQTRSADEPMTIFYRCIECKETWRE